MISYWDDLRAALESLPDRPRDWHAHEFELFFEIETVLHLHESLILETNLRSAYDAWGIISGYCVDGINAQFPARQMCINLRNNLRYVKSANAWRFWLNWYKTQPEGIRLYRFEFRDQDVLNFRQRVYEAAFRELRLKTYAELFAPRTPATRDSRPFAEAGDYTFKSDETRYRVTITPQMAAFAQEPYATLKLPTRVDRPSLQIDLDHLSCIAEELDQREARLKIRPRGWAAAVHKLNLASIETTGLQKTRSLTLDGLLHLAGMLGSGKSTLIWVLTYALAKQGLHVTVVMNTIVESVRMAVWLRQMGISATPGFGKDRPAHESRIALSDELGFRVDKVYQGETNDHPVFAWIPSPCALSGSFSEPLPQNDLPCGSLRSAEKQDHTNYLCPLLHVCPVHHVSRDLIESQVWVINSFSFLYTRVPYGIESGNLRLFEAIYRQSDVVIVDEADRVQVQWDREFAPSQPLAGSSDSLLDELHQDLGNRFVGEVGRQRAATAQFHRLSMSENQIHRLSSQIFRLLMTQPSVIKWIKRQLLITDRLFSRLQMELVKQEPNPELRPQRAEALKEAFHAYWRNPLHRENGDLATWINQLLTENPNERLQLKILERWLAKQMGWNRQQRKQHREFLHKLHFALLFAALIKRTQEITYQLRLFNTFAKIL
jgi:hypothetical protein